MSSGLISQIARQIGCRPKVIVTGGYIKVMRKFIQSPIDAVDQNLVFKGIEVVLE